MIWKPRLPGVSHELTRPFIPKGVRVYAIGDIHGRADLLAEMFERIDADLAENPIADPIHIFLGDYIDRGPESAAVLDLLIKRGLAYPTKCLKGNHELYLMEFFENPEILRIWGQYGGLTTLLSYGLQPSMNARPQEQEDLSLALRRAMPKAHLKFLSDLPLSVTCGDFFFVHAGVRPGSALSRQREEDMLWIRDDFLESDEIFEKVIVHGHTPVMEPQVRKNRINIDTGAYATGRLTCLRLERDQITFL
ncbi:metallophosphoesterase family protein [Methylocapsa palsarum]|uniref:Serine/threonine protein phosphatase 1 n=1 Tax=Methylocapsa palsarum TaxID=1612308 RepID=A0A1I4C6C4_9HYPH|nr:metallophosphoesterase family protein [Methylocapsa palsarum]SFK75839.1 serine/threonine protein phosphatase 1 [Methylocapsa palsarum]